MSDRNSIYCIVGVLAEDVTTQRQGVISLGFFSYDDENEDEDEDDEGTTKASLGTTTRRTTGTNARSGREQ